jgi:glycosyltransferase involved in cell wall biosynthesis
MSRVDVIVPCYKYAHYLKGCVNALLYGQGVDVRVLVIDDCSPDDTPAVAAELVAADSRVQYRRHQTNIGHIATYNEGIEWAESEYMMVLSADDLLTPGALGRAVRLMDAHPEVGLSYGRAIMTGDPAGYSPSVPADYKVRVLSGLEVLEACCAAGGNRVPTQTAVVRTALQKELGGYRPDLPHSGDLEMWLRFALRASVGVVDADQAYYRVHGGNMHMGYASAVLGDMDQYRRTFQIVFERHADRIPRRERLYELAMHKVAMRAVRKASVFFERGDTAGCEQLLRFARQTSPRLQREPAWRRLRVKRTVGPQVWSLVRRGLDYVRGRDTQEPPFRRIGLFPQM